MVSMKVPLIIASSLICLALGLGAGVFGMTLFGYQVTPQGSKDDANPDPNKKGDPANNIDADGKGGMPGMGKGGMPGMGKGGMPGMGKGGMPGMGKGGMPGMGKDGMPGKGFGGFDKTPSSKSQLANLVGKLDVLTQKPLTVTLDDDRKKSIQKQLEGLDTLEELSEETAKERLDALLVALATDRATLEAAGFLWPGGKGQGSQMPKDDSNPFKTAPNEERLQALQKRLTK